jgi:aldehyde dehydrogenase (NAD+)
VERVRLAGAGEIEAVLRAMSGRPLAEPPGEIYGFLRRLRDELAARRDELIDLTRSETGFITDDSREIIDGAMDFLDSFETYARRCPETETEIHHSYSSSSERRIRLTTRPFGLVAAVVPQNASFCLAITVIAAALHAGARVAVRFSLQSAASGEILAQAIEASGPPPGAVAVVNCLANDFIGACCASEHVEILHYIGSNRHATDVLQRAFTAGKVCLLDGQGNGLLYVDDSYPPEEAARIIVDGATRMNGETCTSVNGALIDPAVYDRVRELVLDRMGSLRVGDPALAGTRVGPLFSPRQAEELRRELVETPGGKILVGGDVDGAYFTPAVLEGVEVDDVVAREGVFGPAVWIRATRRDEVRRWIRSNRFPLSDTVLSLRPEVVREFVDHARAARVCVNVDPSVESMFEPWGGYPPGSLNPVSLWSSKYRKSYQLDGDADQIRLAEESRPTSG